jgi:flagellar motor switch protein FliN/FliY
MPDELKQEDLDALLSAASRDAEGGTLAQQEVEQLLKGSAPVLPVETAGEPSGAAFPEIGPGEPVPEGVEGTFELLGDVRLRARIELGRRRMYVEDILRLGQGSVVELDKLAGDPVDILINEVLVARGEVVVLNDNFCVRVTEIISPKDGAAVGR